MAKSRAALLGGGGLLAGSLGILSLAAYAVPAFGVAHHLREALDLYLHYIRYPVLGFVGLREGWSPLWVDLAILWLSTFAAINAFIYQIDGTLIWEHVGRNYCFKVAQSNFAQVMCRLPKVGIAFLLGPLIFIVAVYAAVRTGRSYLTMAFVTVDPVVVSKFLLALFVIPTILIAVTAMVLRATSSG